MKNKIIFFTLLSLFISAQIWFFYLAIQYPYLGILLQQNKNKQWVIHELETNGKALKLDLSVGDIIVKVDGESPNTYGMVQRWGQIEQSDSLVISRNGEEFDINTKLVGNFSNTDMLSFFGDTVCLFFAVLLYFKVRNSSSVILLSLVFVNIAFIFASLEGSTRGDILGKIFINTLLTLLPVVFLHFLIVFLKEKAMLKFRYTFIYYLYGLVALILLIRGSFLFPSISYPVYKYTGKITILLFLLGILLNFCFLTVVHFKYRKDNLILSTFIKTIYTSLFISLFPIICFSFIPQLLFGSASILSLYTSWFVLFFPLSFAYLIMTKQLYDIDLVLRRILFTTLLALLPSGAITVLNAVIFNKEATNQHLLFSFIWILILISFVLYSLEYFMTKLEAVMFPRKYHLQQALKKIAANLGTISSFREMKDMILVDIVNTLQVFGAAIVLKYQDRTESVSAGKIQLEEVERRGTLEVWNHPTYSCLEINRNEEYASYLIITGKKTNTILGTEDTQWLNLIISYLAVSMENLHLIGKLNMRLQLLAAQIPNEQAAQDFIWFRKLMFDLQEAERKRIATDLHDTTLQDLFFLKKRFTAIIEKLELQQDEQEDMKGIIDYVEIINTNLRQSCFELHPHLLYEIGLIETIQKVIKNESMLCPFELEFHARGVETIEHWDLEIKHHVFRIIQELLNNAKKHSEASRVSMVITRENDCFRLVYEDDGVGFQTDSESVREIGSSGTGMEQMKSRILHLDGHMEIRTSPGRGLKLWITLPVRKVQLA